MEYIEFQNVSKQFGSQLVLSDIRLSVKKGELVSLLGP
jgi:ABC-type sugar transport system ATPase subunit